MTADRSPEEHAALVARLRSPQAYPHPVDHVDLIETHISSVLLAGAYAYKLKKPLTLGFLDFSTTEARRAACAEEVRLNRRTAPGLYLDVVAIAGPAHAPGIGRAGPAIEYAVCMRRFPDTDLLDCMARKGRLAPATIDALAETVAAFHASLPPSSPDKSYGTPTRIRHWTSENFVEMARHCIAGDLRAQLASLEQWTTETLDRRSHQFAARRHDGFVRECHGDLHLRNIVMIDGRPVLFDCIEFNPELRWIDVMSEIAFTFMDLEDHGHPALAWRFLNGYLEQTGDYGGLVLMPFYAVYRALVRAKVAILRAVAPHLPPGERATAAQASRRYIELAGRMAGQSAPLAVLMHGLPGAGKSTVAARLAQTLPGIRVRSDIERKRLHGLGAQARSTGTVGAGIYGEAGSAATYARLADATQAILDAGYPAILDATFGRRADRASLIAVAREHDAEAVVLDCRAPAAVLRERIAARQQRGEDPSDATLAVLTHQSATRDPLTAGEKLDSLSVDTDCTAAELDQRIDLVAVRLAALARRTGHHARASTDLPGTG